MGSISKQRMSRVNNSRIDRLYAVGDITFREAITGIRVAYNDRGHWTVVKPAVDLSDEGFQLKSEFDRYKKPSVAVRDFLVKTFPSEWANGQFYL